MSDAFSGHLPKYWSVEDQKVYSWQEWKPQLRIGEENPGFLKLGIRHGALPAWENVYGLFQAANDWRRGAFAGAVPHAVSEGPPRPTLRRFALLTSYENRVPLKGHALEVLDAVDDNGNNHIVMRLEYLVEDSTCISYMGKKQVRGS